MATPTEQLERIKTNALALSGATSQTNINIVTQTTIDQCLTYCNREDITPEEGLFESVITNIVARVYLTGLNENPLTEYKEGDLTEKYDLDDNAFNEKKMLDNHRKMLSGWYDEEEETV